MTQTDNWMQRNCLACGMVLMASVALSACGMSSLTSGLSGGMFGKKSPTPVQSVTEDQLLTAAKASHGPTTGSVSNINVAYGCPRFQVWSRDNSITRYLDGSIGDGLSVMHRGEITRTARECQIEPGRVTVKYGFSGRVLLGPKGQAGRVTLPINVFVTDAKRERVAADKMTIAADVSLERPIGYFSQVRTVTFNIPQGTRPGDFEVFVGFEQPPAPVVPAAGSPAPYRG
ncbi:MAG: hypothetical protein ACR2PA_01750 [Hyphomicrobiaceae bacterium]